MGVGVPDSDTGDITPQVTSPPRGSLSVQVTLVVQGTLAVWGSPGARCPPALECPQAVGMSPSYVCPQQCGGPQLCR